jgi:hypothetical protein
MTKLSEHVCLSSIWDSDGCFLEPHGLYLCLRLPLPLYSGNMNGFDKVKWWYTRFCRSVTGVTLFHWEHYMDEQVSDAYQVGALIHDKGQIINLEKCLACLRHIHIGFIVCSYGEHVGSWIFLRGTEYTYGLSRFDTRRISILEKKPPSLVSSTPSNHADRPPLI